MGDWQPIETAPENRAILVYVPNTDHYGPGCWRAILVVTDYGRRWHSTGLHVGRDMSGPWVPTHWMELPEAPNA